MLVIGVVYDHGPILQTPYRLCSNSQQVSNCSDYVHTLPYAKVKKHISHQVNGIGSCTTTSFKHASNTSKLCFPLCTNISKYIPSLSTQRSFFIFRIACPSSLYVKTRIGETLAYWTSVSLVYTCFKRFGQTSNFEPHICFFFTVYKCSFCKDSNLEFNDFCFCLLCPILA